MSAARRSAGRLAEAGLSRGRHRAHAGRRRVPVLGLHPDQDDDPGRQRARRGAAHPRPGRRRPPCSRTGRRSPRGSATRPPTTWDDKVAVDRFTGKGGRFVRGSATIVGPGRVKVDDQEYAAARGLVIATGTVAGHPADRRARRHAVLDQSRGGRGRRPCPRSLIVLGGGAIGLELSQVMRPVRRAGHGDRGQRPAARDGGAGVVRAGRARRLAADGVEIRTGVRARARRVTTAAGSPSRSTDGATVTGGPAAGRHRPRGPARRPRPGHDRPRPVGAVPRRPTTGCGPATRSGRSAT